MRGDRPVGGRKIACGDGIVDGLMGLPCQAAVIPSEAMCDPLRVDLQQRRDQVLEHCVLSGSREREVEFAIEDLTCVVILRQRLGALEYVAHGLEVGPSRSLDCESDHLTLEEPPRLPEVSNPDALHRQDEQRGIVDQGHPAEWTNDRTAAVAGLDDVECLEALHRLPDDGEADTHGFRELALRGQAMAGPELAGRDALQNRLRDLVR